ncbi:MAG: proprotein convertase P-domain-containing protein [Deltaproteobacteria bacterium]|nr:proprotein convertase P-domain-containing protein [Deltaproteobacteria bacterium]
MRRWSFPCVLAVVVSSVACGGTDEKVKEAQGGDKDGLDHYSQVQSAVSNDWVQVQTVQSAHPYADSYSRTWSINGSAQAVEMRVVFQRFELEDGYDFLSISNAAGDTVTRHTGTQTSLEAVVPGDRIDLKLATDSSVTAYGFRATVYERRGCACPAVYSPVCGNDDHTYSNACAAQCAGVPVRHPGECAQGTWEPVPTQVASPHPYANNTNRTWTLSHGGARRIRVHFTSIDVERGYDFVRLLDARGNLVHEYTGRDSDVTTAEVAGDTVQVQLKSDRSITGFGFAIDRFEVQGGCASDADCAATEQCIQVQCIRAPCFRTCAPRQPNPSYQTVTLAALQANPQAFDGRAIEVVATPALGNSVCTRIACSPANPCCNRCSAGYSIGGDISLTDAGEQGFGCSGNECNPAQSCNPSFGPEPGELTFRGTFHTGAFGAQRLAVDNFRANNCHATGCSSQVCANTNVITTCEARPEYACYRSATCTAQAGGLCGWTQTPELVQCLANGGGNTGREFPSRDTPLSIPDDRSGGVTSRIELSGVGSPRSLTASLAVTHPYRGDLRVTLTAPNGRSQVLHDKAGGSFDDLVLENVDISALGGANPAGVWRLQVEDLAASDTGTLNGWSLRAN